MRSLFTAASSGNFSSGLGDPLTHLDASGSRNWAPGVPGPACCPGLGQEIERTMTIDLTASGIGRTASPVTLRAARPVSRIQLAPPREQRGGAGGEGGGGGEEQAGGVQG